MLPGITGFEIRYQLKNPVFWVSVAVFFLLGFGLTASENVSIGTPGAVHENAPYAIAVATAILSLFYLFVITAFVANAIVRDDATGFAPIVRSTSVTRTDIVLGQADRQNEKTSGVELDPNAMQDWKEGIVKKLTGGVRSLIKGAGSELMVRQAFELAVERGEQRPQRRRLAVAGRVYQFGDVDRVHVRPAVLCTEV